MLGGSVASAPVCPSTVGDGVLVDVWVGSGVSVPVGDGVGAGVAVSVGSGVSVTVGDGVLVGVCVGSGVSVPVGDGSAGVAVLRWLRCVRQPWATVCSLVCRSAPAFRRRSATALAPAWGYSGDGINVTTGTAVGFSTAVRIGTLVTAATSVGGGSRRA